MGSCNWDELLAYPTIHIIKVKDRYLGGIRYLMLLVIFAYIIGYVVIKNGGYNLCIVPDGSIELSLKKPDGYINPSNYTYCTQYKGTPNISDPLPCVVVDESDVYQPVDQTNAMFVTTRFSQTLEKRNPECNSGAGCADPWIEVNHSNYTGATYYGVGIENFTVRLGHFFQARQFYLESRQDWYSQSCAQMSGKLLDVTGKKIEDYGNNEADIIRLETILNAANVDINDLSDNPTDAAYNESFRHAGLVIFFGIDYNGVYDKPVTYTYTATQVPKVEYKITRTTTVSEDERLVSNTHGIKLYFEFSGKICQFDFQTLLIQLVSGLGLLSMATVITDLMMAYCMPLRRVYLSYKYKETAHHDDLVKKATHKRIEIEKSASSVKSNSYRGIDNHDSNDTAKSVNNKYIPPKKDKVYG